MKDKIVGTIFVRKSNKKLPGDNRELVMLMGIVSLPNRLELEGEKLYLTIGQENDEGVTLHLSQPHKPLKDMSGYRADQIFTEPIWKINKPTG